jgi:hypothetical protein
MAPRRNRALTGLKKGVAVIEVMFVGPDDVVEW